MANYKDIHGTTVRNSAGNLSGAATGELFYDSTNRDFKYSYPNVSSSWRTGNDLNTGRQEINKGSSGTQTSALAFGGTTPPRTAITESYNGTSWTEVSDLNTAKNALQGAGASNTAVLAFGGDASPETAVTELWDGSSWTEKNDLNNGMRSGGGTGASNSAMSVGGDSSPVTDNAETWNGTSWTNITEMGQAREGLGAAGATNTAVIIFAGGPSSDAQT